MRRRKRRKKRRLGDKASELNKKGATEGKKGRGGDE
jgi:hypothetical protein